MVSSITTNPQVYTSNSTNNNISGQDATEFNQLMQTAMNSQNEMSTPITPVATPQTKLLTDADSSRNARPNIKEFIDATGASFEDASELIYGVIGSNTDTRNWSAIMSSPDPISTLRQATGLMYNQSTTTPTANSTENLQTIARNGNFSLTQHQDEQGNITHQGIGLNDANGNLLRTVGPSAEQIQRNAWLFGFNTQELQPLIEPAKTLSTDIATAISNAINNTQPLPAPPTPVSAAITPEAFQDNTTENITDTPTQPTIESISAQLSQLSANLVNNQPTTISTYLNQITQIQTMMQQLNALEAQTKEAA